MSDKYKIKDEYGRTIGYAERELSPFEKGQRAGAEAAGYAILLLLLWPLIKGFGKYVLAPVVGIFVIVIGPLSAFAFGMGVFYIPHIGSLLGVASFLLMSFVTLDLIWRIIARVQLQHKEETIVLGRKFMRNQFMRNQEWKPLTWKDWLAGLWYILVFGCWAAGSLVGMLALFGSIEGFGL
jgi:hypothetical protein